MRPESVRVPLPLKVLLVLDGFPFAVDVVAAVFWTNSKHDVLVVAVHPDPKLVVVHVAPVDVPGAHNETVPLVIETVA